MRSEYSVFIRGLDGGLLCLPVHSTQSIASLKEKLQDAAGIPAEEQLLGYRHSLEDEASLLDSGISADAVISLSGRLRGGKGGFGSLLRGSGKGAVTENEDACRDLSGRRLRLVNAEKKLQEWAAADKQRRDEKKDAKQAREQLKAEEREAAAQVELEAVRKDQKVVLSRVAQAIESSLQAGNKRAGSAATQPQTKKPRYSSESEEEDSDEGEEDSDNERTEPVSGVVAGAGGPAGKELDAVEVPQAQPTQHQPSLQAVT